MANQDKIFQNSTLVQKPAIDLFIQLGWSYQDCFTNLIIAGKASLVEKLKADVVLVSKLRSALKKLNKNVSDTAIDEAIKALTADRSLMGMVQANREVYEYLKNGILVSYLNDKKEIIQEKDADYRLE